MVPLPPVELLLQANVSPISISETADVRGFDIAPPNRSKQATTAAGRGAEVVLSLEATLAKRANISGGSGVQAPAPKSIFGCAL